MQKKWVIGITAVTLAAATAIGSTLAYFTATTQKMTNSFAVATGDDKGITGQLREPAWDGYVFNDYVNKGTSSQKDPDGADVLKTRAGDTSLGINQAKIILPGDTIQKDPTLMNTTNWNFTKDGGPGLYDKTVDVPVYMAMEVTYTGFNNVKINSDNKINKGWKDIATSPIDPVGTCTKTYVWYGLDANGETNTAPAAVSSGSSTAPLFNTVTVNTEATHNDGTESTVLKSFDIKLQGAAIQTRNVPVAEINSRLTALLP